MSGTFFGWLIRVWTASLGDVLRQSIAQFPVPKMKC